MSGPSEALLFGLAMACVVCAVAIIACDDVRRCAIEAEREACAKLIDDEIAADSAEEDPRFEGKAEARRYRACLRLLAAAVRDRGKSS
jgi:hypothetical protein